MEKIKAKVEQVLHKDNSSATGHSGTTSTGHTSEHTANAADPTGTGYSGQQSGLTGQHGTGHTGHDSGLTSSNQHGTGHDSGLTSGNQHSGLTSDNQHSGLTSGNQHSTGAGGHGTSNFANKLDNDQYGGHGNTTGIPGSRHDDPTGPHQTRTANQLDPRVGDSEYGNTQSTGGLGGLGRTEHGTGHGTGHGTSGSLGRESGLHEGTSGGFGRESGLHEGTSGGLGRESGALHSGTSGVHGTGHGTSGGYGRESEGLTSGGYGRESEGLHQGASGGYGGQSGGLTGGTSGGYGTGHGTGHESNLANRADPRIDSTPGYGNNQYGSDSNRTHNSGLGNTSGTTAYDNTSTSGTGVGGYGTDSHRTGEHQGSHLPGPAPDTQGPSKSNIMNKLNPTVDSDASKGVEPKYREKEGHGGQQGYGSGQQGYGDDRTSGY